jgi:hypothetical protein
VGISSLLPWPHWSWQSPLILLGGAVLLLNLIRTRLRGQSKEARLSSGLLPLTILLFGALASVLSRDGIPTWAPVVGIFLAALYGQLSGRDFSFVGGTLLSLIVSSVLIAGFAVQSNWATRTSGLALALNAIYLLYIMYDLASLLSRRRLGEEWAAVADLYRDMFNVFGYLIRVWHHWRKYRIWEAGR